MGEASLVEQAKSGNKDALLELIMNQKDEYYRLAYVYLGNPDDVLDILQDTIVTLYQNIRKLRKNEVFHSWAKTILVNLCKRQLKRKKKVIFFEAFTNINLYSNLNLSNHHASGSNLNSSSQVDFKIEPTLETPEIDLRLDIKKELEKLNPYQKEVILLKYFLDLDNETIALITKSPVGTVKSRIYYALIN